MGRRQEKANEILRALAADFFERESNGLSLMTMTRADISPDLKSATIFFTVLPEDKEEMALDFAKRRRKELREFMKEHAKFRVLPFFDVEIDKVQKIEQKLSNLHIKE